MKKLLFVLLPVLLFSCAKEHCYECQEVISDNVIIAPSSYGEKYMKCGCTRSEIKKHEDSSYVSGGRYTHTVKCVKQD